MLRILVFFLAFLGTQALALTPLDPKAQILTQDLEKIAKSASWPLQSLSYSNEPSQDQNRVHISCSKDGIHLEIKAIPGEGGATLYFGLQNLGFSFPHPRMQISPSLLKAKKLCGQEFMWKPRLLWRGFHLHLQHPNEWVEGFLGTSPEIAQDTYTWLMRNGQNLLDLELLRNSDTPKLAAILEAAPDYGLRVGVSVSFSMIQQKSFSLLPIWRAIMGWGAESALERGLNRLKKRLRFDFICLELGSSEFTSLSYQKTFAWLDLASNWAEKNGIDFFTKVHVSSNQSDPEWGNYNFIAERARPQVGVLVHTTYIYGLEDKQAPMYGRENFLDLKDFLRRQKDSQGNWKRATWYFPETSYFIGLDIDVPLFLTSFLVHRARDQNFLAQEKIAGLLTFSTGQELGYWLFDWCSALATSGEFRDPLACLARLGEDQAVWQKIIDFQEKYFYDKQGVALLVGSNLMDELPGFRPIHRRVLLRELFNDPRELDREIKLLAEMREARPDLARVKNQELQAMLQVTWLRIDHSYWVRRGLQDKKYLFEAKQSRELAHGIMQEVQQKFSRYKEAKLFEERENPTSYGYGYAWPALTLYNWQRDEEIVEGRRVNPFFHTIYNLWKILF